MSFHSIVTIKVEKEDHVVPSESLTTSVSQDNMDGDEEDSTESHVSSIVIDAVKRELSVERQPQADV